MDQHLRPGISTAGLDRVAARVFTEHGARSAPALVYGFPGTVAAAIEPMISGGSPRVVTGADGWTVRTRDGCLAAHDEHTLVITPGAPVVLTAAA